MKVPRFRRMPITGVICGRWLRPMSKGRFQYCWSCSARRTPGW